MGLQLIVFSKMSSENFISRTISYFFASPNFLQPTSFSYISVISQPINLNFFLFSRSGLVLRKSFFKNVLWKFHFSDDYILFFITKLPTVNFISSYLRYFSTDRPQWFSFPRKIVLNLIDVGDLGRVGKLKICFRIFDQIKISL